MKKPKAIPGFVLTMFLIFNGAAGFQGKSVQQLKIKLVEHGFEKERIFVTNYFLNRISITSPSSNS